jgi:tRNA-specific 2-thiouridylase
MVETIAVAMSGGVDSTVCAALLREHFAVRGFFMDLGLPDGAQQIAAVRAIAARLGIELEVVDLARAFREQIVDYFRESYGAGRTPNPCVLCNPLIKCGELLAAVRRGGIDRMATGHYVRREEDAAGVRLLAGADPGKDQSYFLCGLSPEQLRHLVFPLGEMRKEEVYRLARNLGFAHAPDTESQDICFLKGRDLGDFLKNGTDGAKGDIVTTGGEKVGRHAGVRHYTVGQRRGLGICDATPYYVIALSAGENQVIVGKEPELWHDRLLVADINWLGGAPPLPARLAVKIRYRHQAAAAELSRAGDLYLVRFAAPQRAITPGQFAVFYDQQALLGGGEIVGRA